MARMSEHPDRWEVPYLPIDPVDVGRNYDPIIRINSQSGKGGVAYILEKNFGLVVPKIMQADFSRLVTKVSDENNKELEPQEIYDLFIKTYANVYEPLHLIYYNEYSKGSDDVEISVDMEYNGEKCVYKGAGTGVLDAFCKAVQRELNISFEIGNYSEHSLDFGNKSRAVTYMVIYDEKHNPFYGVGISSGITKSSLRAVVSAVNKIIATK
jgi:2-isopropylmalate synthase